MDSGNSGSLQSSSGGDEDYDSRTESISSFLNPSFHFPQISSSNHPPQQQQPPPPPLSLHPNQQQQLPPTFFDPQNHNLNPFSHSSNPNSSNPLYNLDPPPLWHHQRSDPNYNNNNNDANPSSVLLPSSSNQSLLRPQRPNLVVAGSGPGPSSSVPLPDNNSQPTTVKTSRKRTRASRRAPTTVLTTDTSNFRQMVQEFTGIPAPPFSATAVSPYSRRFDIFSSALRSSSGGPMEALSPLFNHPFRPSAQKPQHPSSTTASFLSNSISGPASSTFQINPSDLGFLSKNPLNPQNNFPLQSLLQDPNSLKYTQATTATLGELGLPHDHVSGNLAAFPGLAAPPEDQAQHLGSYSAGYNHHNNNKVNGSDFNSEKRMENTAAATAQRNGGTADPWVCPSD